MAKAQKKENPEMDLTTVTADEFDFILDDMRLKQKSIIANSDYSRSVLYNDLKTSRDTKIPLKTYWVAILINLVGETPFFLSRKNYKSKNGAKNNG